MFDLNTLRLVAMVSFVGFVFIAMMLWHLVPQERSMKYWGLSALLIACGLFLLGLRGYIPDFLSIVTANTLMMLGVGFMYAGTRMLLNAGIGRHWHWYAAALAFLICIFAPGVSERVAATSVLYVLFFLGCSLLFWSKSKPGLVLISRIAALIFSTGAILFMYRAINPPLQAPAAIYVSTMNFAEALPYLYTLLLSMWLPLTLMLMVSTRLQNQRSDALERAEQALSELKESQSLWQFAIEGSGDGVWDWDVVNKKVFYSKRWKELLGYSEAEIGEGLEEWGKRIHPDDKAGTEAAVKRHFDGETASYSHEHRLLCKDGTYKWILTRGLVVSRDSAGKPLRAIGTHTDISELKLQQAHMQFRNRILVMLARGEPIGQVMLATVTGIEAIHPEMICSILLLDHEGKRLTEGVAPSLPDFYNEAITGIEVGVGKGSCGTAAVIDERVIVDDISTHPYWQLYKHLAARAGLAACWSQPIRSSTHHVLGTFAIYHRKINKPSAADIELIEQCADLISIALDKNAAEVSLNDREKQLELVLDASQLGFWDWDIKKDRVVRNERWASMLGYQLDDIEFTVKQWIDFIHPDDQARAYQSIQDCLEGLAPAHSIEYRMRTKDGQYKWILDQAQVVERDANQKATRMCGTHTDVTERKLMEEQIRHQALYDGLTQLPNRYLFEDRLRQAMVKSKRTGCYGALMFLDLDNFKPLNDHYGHAVGDLLLIEVAARLKNCVREADTVARIGGDEFVVELEQLDTDKKLSEKEAEFMADKIRKLLAEPYFLKITSAAGKASTVVHHCTASIGVVLFIGNEVTPEEILKRSDDAMYLAKDAGRNQVKFHEVKILH
jgi:diguanylate cyclase (GGDEF)-like protein/PAS domain S-box-containing protein